MGSLIKSFFAFIFLIVWLGRASGTTISNSSIPGLGQDKSISALTPMLGADVDDLSDYLAIYDGSASIAKKILVGDLLALVNNIYTTDGSISGYREVLGLGTGELNFSNFLSTEISSTGILLSGNSITDPKIELTSGQLRLATPGVQTGTSTVGQVLSLNNLSGAVEYVNASSLLVVQNGLTQAGSGEIELGGTLLQSTEVDIDSNSLKFAGSIPSTSDYGEVSLTDDVLGLNSTLGLPPGVGIRGVGEFYRFNDGTNDIYARAFMGDSSALSGGYSMNFGMDCIYCGSNRGANVDIEYDDGTGNQSGSVQLQAGSDTGYNSYFYMSSYGVDLQFEDVMSLGALRIQYHDALTDYYTGQEATFKNLFSYWRNNASGESSESTIAENEITLAVNFGGNSNYMTLKNDGLSITNLVNMISDANTTLLGWESGAVVNTGTYMSNILVGATGAANLVSGNKVKGIKEGSAIKFNDDGLDVTIHRAEKIIDVISNPYVATNAFDMIVIRGVGAASCASPVSVTLPDTTTIVDGFMVNIKVMSNDCVSVLGQGGTTSGDKIDDVDTTVTPFLIDGSSGSKPNVEFIYSVNSGTWFAR